ncbi:hypothetical protein, partial [Bacillus altitudinis]|uniref:hypothetical protein n=1 Tax=Bacillus altitudinis TaxID=293387 RepID=UPI001C930496
MNDEMIERDLNGLKWLGLIDDTGNNGSNLGGLRMIKRNGGEYLMWILIVERINLGSGMMMNDNRHSF